jgi:DNA polymerase-3 subunit delta'
VLVSAQPDALLPTVRSRCYRLRFGPVGEEDVARVLRERHGMAEADARAASALSDGSIGRALAIESGRLVEARDAATRVLRTVSSGRLPHRLQGGKDFVAGPRAGAVDRGVLAERLRALSSILRDLELLATRADHALVANADLKGELEAILPAFNAPRVLRAFSAVDRASAALERNASPKIVADWLASEL